MGKHENDGEALKLLTEVARQVSCVKLDLTGMQQATERKAQHHQLGVRVNDLSPSWRKSWCYARQALRLHTTACHLTSDSGMYVRRCFLRLIVLSQLTQFHHSKAEQVLLPLPGPIPRPARCNPS